MADVVVDGDKANQVPRRKDSKRAKYLIYRRHITQLIAEWARPVRPGTLPPYWPIAVLETAPSWDVLKPGVGCFASRRHATLAQESQSPRKARDGRIIEQVLGHKLLG